MAGFQISFRKSVCPILTIVLPIPRCLKDYRYVCYLFAVALDGLCYLCLPVLQSFPLLVPFSCTFGYFDGAYVTLIPVVTAEIVGTTSLSSALGVVYFLHAVPYLVSPPIAGKCEKLASHRHHIDVEEVNTHLWTQLICQRLGKAYQVS